MGVFRYPVIAMLLFGGVCAGSAGVSMARDTSAGPAALVDISLPEVRRSLEAPMPGGLRLTTVTSKDSKVAFSGLAESTAQITVYLRALGREAAFKNPALIQTQRDRATGLLKFDMEVEVTCQPATNGGRQSLCRPASPR
ncbi:MAG: PilN domain-containing protein [bacterium]|jgi:hypothetical protein|nr:PilN domain-containing protein [Betaproteobacteria bacterium]